MTMEEKTGDPYYYARREERKAAVSVRNCQSPESLSPRRRKPKSDRKEATILIRLTDEQKATLTAASKKAGLDLSSWIRSLALREAASSEAA